MNGFIIHARRYGLTWLVTLFMLVDAAMKVFGAQVSLETTEQLGFAESQVYLMGWILLISTLLYAVRRTAVIGAVLTTGYLGGAIAVQLQHNAPLYSHVLFGVYLGILMWVALILRKPELRSVLGLEWRVELPFTGS